MGGARDTRWVLTDTPRLDGLQPDSDPDMDKEPTP